MLKSLQPFCLGTSLCLMLLLSCSKDEDNPSPQPEPGIFLQQDAVIAQSLSVNSSGSAPLTALLSFTTSEAVSTRLRVLGKHGPASDVMKNFEENTTLHNIPVLGLYADHENTVEVTLVNSDGASLGTSSFTIQTAPMIADMPFISVQTNNVQKAAGMTLVSYFGHSSQVTPQRPFIFDEFGDIRWYLSFNTDPVLSGLFYDDGIERLRNGNYYFGDRTSSRIYEVDLLGQIVNSWTLPGYSFHHEVHEKPNGNFLVTVNNNSIATVEDHVIEIDRLSGDIVNVWDLRASLQQGRTAWTEDQTDWIHANALTYDENDDTIIISGRTQGTIKLTRDNKVVWIIAPHRGWAEAGEGTDLRAKLLQPLDASGQAIDAANVLDGSNNAADFEWPWYQHAPQVMPNGNVLLFDNGDNRNYQGAGTYSRAVEYAIDPVNMTIRQVWEYGKARGGETYSRIVSDVDFDPESGHVFFSPGAVVNSAVYGKIVEIDHASGQILFEATVQAPVAPFDITFHRTERLSLYPD